MTTTNDILNVLRKYNHQKVTIDLSKAKDCTDFWNEFVRAVYYVLPETEIRDSGGNYLYRIDSDIRNKLDSFAKQDNLELVNKSGKLLKRFAKYYKEQTGTKLDDSTLGIIGDKLQYYLNQQSVSYVIDFSDVIDWKDGKFGKSGSCWWGTYSDSIPTFVNGGGWAIRFYDSMDDTDGIGRTWLVPSGGVLLGFNSYGIERPKVSKVIKALFAQHDIELHYQRTRIYNSCNNTIPYINESDESDNGFVLYPTDRTPEDEYDLEMESQTSEHCTHCGTSIDTEFDSYEMIGDSIYCESCAFDLFSNCDRCGEWYDNGDVHKVKDGDEYLCEYCAKGRDLVLCYQCNEYTDEITYDHDGDNFCNECAQSHLTFCEHCNEYYHDRQIENHDCPKNRDYSGLVECPNYNLHAQIRNIETYNHNVTVYKIDGCDGLAMVDVHTIDSDMDGWNICHETSGLAVKSGLTFNHAKYVFQQIAFLTDWTQESTKLSADQELMSKVHGLMGA